jgi:UDP-MurNAc hydroxylase
MLPKTSNQPPLDSVIKHLGHASIYIRNSSVSLVVDPWFSETEAFLSSWHQFPEPTGVDLDEARAVDYVLLSHEHLDHFDLEFIKTINCNAVILIPTFSCKYFLDCLSVLPNKIIEVDYKESV